MLVLGYVRVSTIEQESGFGRQAQASRIEAYCTDHGLSDLELTYESQSGESIAKRLELHRVLARAEAAVDSGMQAHVVFAGLDRLTRDLIDQEAVTTRCFRTGVRLHSTLGAENDTLDPSYAGDPMRTAIRQFFGIINQLDRAIIQRRMDGGLAKKAGEGGFTGGRIPFGYRSSNRELEIDPDATSAVQRVFELHAAGLDQASVAAVVSKEYPEKCGHWRKQQIGRVLDRRELYAQGLYRPRGGTGHLHRPDLILLRVESPGRAPRPSADIDWARMPDPVRLVGLATLLGVPEIELTQLIQANNLLVRWRRSAAFVPKKTAQRLQALASGKTDN